MGFPVVDLWNTKNLEPPPINSAKADLKEIDVKFLGNVLKDAIDFFNEQPYLFSEAAVLSRTIYRLKMKLRSSKDFKAAEKLNRALRAYLGVEIAKVLKTLLDSVPQVYKSNKTYLPTKQMMDFVLVRIQGLGKILARILETCRIVCQLSQQRMGLGHFWKIAFMIYGMAARIFVIVKSIIKYTCDLYSNLVPYCSKLKNSGIQWLPADYILPENLSDWLEIDWMDLETTVIEIVDDKPEMSFFNLIEDSDDDLEFCDEYILVRDEPSFYQIQKPVKKETLELSDDDEDIGEVINVSDVEASHISNKENLDTGNSTLYGFNNNVDIGEVVNLSDRTSNLEPQRQREENLPSEITNETMNLKNTQTHPRLKIPVKKKKLNLQTTTLPDVIEIIDSPQVKITEKKKKSKRSTTEVIEISDTSFNNEIISFSDNETFKTPINRGKKRKRARNSESDTTEVKKLNPNKKRKKVKSTESDILTGTNNVQNMRNVKQSKKRKVKKNNNGFESKEHVGGNNINKPNKQNVILKVNSIRKFNTRDFASSKNTKKIKKKKHVLTNVGESKNHNVTLKPTSLRKPNILLNNRRNVLSSKSVNLKKRKKKRKSTLNNSHSLTTQKRKHKKKEKKQQL